MPSVRGVAALVRPACARVLVCSAHTAPHAEDVKPIGLEDEIMALLMKYKKEDASRGSLLGVAGLCPLRCADCTLRPCAPRPCAPRPCATAQPLPPPATSR